MQHGITLLRALGIAAGLAVTVQAMAAETTKLDADGANALFGTRTDKADGTVDMTIGRRLPTEWDTKVGTDIKLVEPGTRVPAENFLQRVPSENTSGTIWGNVTMPGLAPAVWDKTQIEARLDAGHEQGKLGATLSRSVPIGNALSLSLQNSYSITQSLPESQPATTMASATEGALPASSATPAWTAGQTVRLNIVPSGTALSVGATTSNAAEQWHAKVSLEQTLLGPLKLQTSIEDVGGHDAKQSITAGFKHAW
jgi:hypothetical protein